MTALRKEAIELVEQLPEEQVINIIQYMNSLKALAAGERQKTGSDSSAKMQAFRELEKMIIPIQNIDYDKELAKARDKKYDYTD